MDGAAMAVELETMPAIPEATERERLEGFDYTSKYYLGISGEEFLRQFDAHELNEDDIRVKKVLRRISLVRPELAQF